MRAWPALVSSELSGKQRTVDEGLATTFRVLTKTDNEASVRALIPALSSPHREIQEGALAAILQRRSVSGGREILRRLHQSPPWWKDVIREHRGRLNRALRDALLGTDREMAAAACHAVVWFGEYDLVPTLLNVLEDRTHEQANLAATSLLELIERLCEAAASISEGNGRGDPQLMKRHVIESLDASLRRFSAHGRREVVEALLLLIRRDNALLRTILQDPHHTAFLATIDLLSHSPRVEIMRLLLSFLDDSFAPSSTISGIAKRGDLPFVRHLLHKIGRNPSSMITRNLKQIRTLAWLRPEGEVLGRLDESAQQAMVRLMMITKIPRLQAFAVVEHLLLHGKPIGRREAAKALSDFNGADANALAMKALEDSDFQVQAIVVAQLRRRGIPGVLPRLVDLLDSPHASVRQAVRESLDEFTFQRFLGAFDMLDDEVRQSTGSLVKKIDPHTLPGLRDELKSPVRTRRLRGLEIAQAIDMVEQLETAIAGLLGDEDHMVRAEAAGSLARCPSESARKALERALRDSSQTVRDTAKRSLNEQRRLAHWQTALYESQD